MDAATTSATTIRRLSYNVSQPIIVFSGCQPDAKEHPIDSDCCKQSLRLDVLRSTIATIESAR